MIDKVKRIILVLSGKGGVGKSTVSTQLALCLKETGLKVGILDVDLCGPSVPYLLNIEEASVHQAAEGWVPVYTDKDQSLAVMSIGFLLKNRDTAVVWRGPKKNSVIKQFIFDVCWGELDVLIIDTPPGTSDEHIGVMEHLRQLKCHGAVIVTSPQEVAIEDVRKEVTFCKKTGIPLLGIVENMSGFVCPTCTECTNIFSSGGGACLAELVKSPLLAVLPIDPRVGVLRGKACICELPDSTSAKGFLAIIEGLKESIFLEDDQKNIYAEFLKRFATKN